MIILNFIIIFFYLFLIFTASFFSKIGNPAHLHGNFFEKRLFLFDFLKNLTFALKTDCY